MQPVSSPPGLSHHMHCDTGCAGPCSDPFSMAGFLQDNFPESEAKTQLDNLRLLQGMGVEVSCTCWCGLHSPARCTILQL